MTTEHSDEPTDLPPAAENVQDEHMPKRRLRFSVLWFILGVIATGALGTLVFGVAVQPWLMRQTEAEIPDVVPGFCIALVREARATSISYAVFSSFLLITAVVGGAFGTWRGARPLDTRQENYAWFRANLNAFLGPLVVLLALSFATVGSYLLELSRLAAEASSNAYAVIAETITGKQERPEAACAVVKSEWNLEVGKASGILGGLRDIAEDKPAAAQGSTGGAGETGGAGGEPNVAEEFPAPDPGTGTE